MALERGTGVSEGRPGKYGPHFTATGKVIYQRPKHFFYPRDAERLFETLQARLESQETFEDVPWYWKLLNRIAEAMLSRIVGLIGLDDEFARIVWNFLNEKYTTFLMNVVPGYNASNLMNYFKNRWENAIDAYTDFGDSTLIDKLLEDLIGGE